MNIPRSGPRSGIALILALVILAALMLMGLPFLFSQSSSLSGTRYLAAGQAVRLYADSARNLGLAVAVYAHERHLADSGTLGSTVPPVPAESWTAWVPTLADYPNGRPVDQRLIAAISDYGNINHNVVALAPQVLPQGWNPPPTDTKQSRSVIGVTLSDEQGKLDINSLGPQGWKALFDKVGIVDPDDSQVKAQDRIAVDYIDLPSRSAHNDISSAGQLADGLAQWRLEATHHYGRLEDLLGVEPACDGRPWGKNGQHPAMRSSLTMAELDRLRPYITANTLGQARGGVVDLGNVIEWVGSPYWRMLHDQPEPDLVPLAGLDSWLEGPTRRRGVLVGDTTAGSGYYIISTNDGTNRDSIAGTDQGLWLRIPPVLNVNTVPTLLRTAMPVAGVTIPAPPGSPDYAFTSLTTLLPATTGMVLGPLWKSANVYQEWPQLATASDGVVSITTRATVYDAAGNPVADAHHRAVVQAVPQESFVERRWQTQSDFEQLQGSRSTSRMQSWPLAFERDASQQPKPDFDDAASTGTDSATATALATRPLRNLASDTKKATHMPIDWRLSLGGDSPKPAIEVLQSSPASRNVDLVPKPNLAPSTGVPADLRPDGLVIRRGTQLGFKLDTTANSPLRALDADNDEVAPQHISMWFQPQEDWVNLPYPVCLAEGRSAPSNTGKMHRITGDVAGDAGAQNYLSLWYEPALKALTLVYAPPTIEWTVENSNEFAAPDNPWTPDVDERCFNLSRATDLLNLWPSGGTFPRPALPDQNRLLNPAKKTPLSAAWQLFSANRIIHLYKVPNGLRQWQWYHLQVCLGTGRPGGMAMILDGNAGNDVSRQTTATFSTGDQATLPMVMMDMPTDLPSVNISTAANDDELKKLYPQTIPFRMPGIAAGLSADVLFPPHGTIQIDSEYISYEKLLVIGTTGGEFQQCTRGVRQNTETNAPDAWTQWPGTRAHAKDAFILPGDVRLTDSNASSKLYAGGCDLADPLQNGDPLNWHVWGKLDRAPSGETANVGAATPVKLDPGEGTPYADWPNQGIVRVFDPSNDGRIIYYHFVKQGTDQLQLGTIADTSGLPINGWKAVGSRPYESFAFSYGGNTQPILWLVSMHVTGNPTEEINGLPRYPYPPGMPVADAPRPSSGPYYVQLTQATGDLEWIAYQTILFHPTHGGYLINSGGWGLYRQVGQATGDDREFTARGRHRTAFDAGMYALAGLQRDIIPNGGDPNSDGVAVLRTLPNKNRPVVSTPRAFSSGAKVIPVQTEFDRIGARLLPGDVVTIQPRSGGLPIQRTVRFVSTNGYASPTLSALQRKSFDVKNGYFAFNDHLDSTIASPLEMATGTAWGVFADLSPAAGWVYRQKVSYLPRLSLMQGIKPDGTPDPGALMIGNADLRRNGTDNSKPVAIDAVTIGRYGERWRATNAAADEQARIMRFIKPDGTITYEIAGDATALGTLAWASTPMFEPVSGNPSKMGLMRMDGEVFAWRRCTPAELSAIAQPAINSFTHYPTEKINVFGNPAQVDNTHYLAVLVGRGLLGSQMKAHTIISAATLTANANRPEALLSNGLISVDGLPHYVGLPAMVLPIGPVAMLADPTLSTPAPMAEAGKLDGYDWFVMGDGETRQVTWNAPAFSVWNAEGTGAFEVVALTDPPTWPEKIPPANTVDEPRFQRWRSATWLRGMYGTDQGGWMGGTHSPIVIGWWPRYASALPPSPSERHYRSRQYAWAGFPARFHSMRVDKDKDVLLGFDATAAAGSQFAEPKLVRKPNWKFTVFAGSAGPLKAPSWTDATWSHPTTQVDGGLPTRSAINDLFSKDTFWDDNLKAMKPVDGVEMRIVWQYPTTVSTGPDGMSTFATYGNAPVAIAPLVLRVRAPATVIATSER